MAADPAASEPCPCSSRAPWSECCGPVIAAPSTTGPGAARTAEALMRSRFAAFAIGDAAHLLRTWHPETRPDAAELAADLASPEAPQWRRLLIRDVVGGADADDRGVVEFIGIGRGSGGRVELHERSQFVRDGGAWLYTTGEILD